MQGGVIMKDFKITKGNIFLYISAFIGVLLFDQVTKILVEQNMQLHDSHTIVESFFYFTFVHNYGAAWGIFGGHTSLLILSAVVGAFIMGYFFVRSKNHETLTRFGLVIAFAGMLGNVIDRVQLGYVRDFFDFVILGYDFPVFNIADMGLVIGMGLVILEIILEDRKNAKNRD